MASDLLNAIPTAWLGVLIVGVSVVLAVGGLLVARRLIPVSILQGHNDVAGFIYAVLGVIYAVLLPFVLVVVWEEFREAEHGTMQEAQTLVGLSQDVQPFPDATRQQVVGQAQRYARTVVDVEWPLLAEGKDSPAAQAELGLLVQTVQEIEPSNARETAAYGLMLARLDALADWRTSRLFHSTSGVPDLMWVVLVVGGILVVGYSYLYGVERLAAQLAMTAALAAMVAMVLYVILVIDYPFTGDFRVDPDDLEAFLRDEG